MTERIAWRDLLWMLAYPAYQTIGTARHESSHAIAAMIQGAKILKFVALPSVQDGDFYWGYVRWDRATGWVTIAMPYVVGAVWFAAFFFLCRRVNFKRHWIWINVVIIGTLTPLIDTGYNYFNGIQTGSTNDVARLLAWDFAPDWSIHAFFVVVLLLNAVGAVLLLGGWGKKTADEF